jgi:carboxy-cis,cis-muconate cyclase
MLPPTVTSEGESVDEVGGIQSPLGARDETSRFETPTSSGKANALDIRVKSSRLGGPTESSGFWILLTDDDRKADMKGAVRVLEWDGWGVPGRNADPKTWEVKVVAEWPDKVGRGGRGRMMGEVVEIESVEPEFTGASHAIWLD